MPILSRRWQAMRASYTGELTHSIVIPAGPDGRPGYRLLAPSETPFVGAIGADQTRSDFQVLVDANGSTLGAVCFGRGADYGAPEDMARPSWDFPDVHGSLVTIDQIRQERFAAFDAVRTVKASGSKRVVVDWFFDRDGWTFAVGVLCAKEYLESAESTARKVLATWTWDETN